MKIKTAFFIILIINILALASCTQKIDNEPLVQPQEKSIIETSEYITPTNDDIEYRFFNDLSPNEKTTARLIISDEISQHEVKSITLLSGEQEVLNNVKFVVHDPHLLEVTLDNYIEKFDHILIQYSNSKKVYTVGLYKFEKLSDRNLNFTHKETSSIDFKTMHSIEENMQTDTDFIIQEDKPYVYSMITPMLNMPYVNFEINKTIDSDNQNLTTLHVKTILNQDYITEQQLHSLAYDAYLIAYDPSENSYEIVLKQYIPVLFETNQ